MMGQPEQDLMFKLKSIGVRMEGEDAAIDSDMIQAILQGKRLTEPRPVVLRDDSKASAPESTRRKGRMAPAIMPVGGRPGPVIHRVEDRIRELPVKERPDAPPADTTGETSPRDSAELRQLLQDVDKLTELVGGLPSTREAVDSVGRKVAAHEAEVSKVQDLTRRLEKQVGDSLEALTERMDSLTERMDSLESSVDQVNQTISSVHTQQRADLHLERAQALILHGRAQEAEDIVRAALFGSSSADDSTRPRERGIFPPEASGMQPLLALAHPDSRYDWGEAQGRHLLAEGLLLYAAQRLDRPDYIPARFSMLPADIREIIDKARHQLQKALELRRQSQDPKSAVTEQVLAELEGGILTRYSLTRRSGVTDVFSSDLVTRRRDSVFISYSRKDREWLEQLQTMLKPLVNKGLSTWDDTVIESGAEWREEIKSALSRAKVAVLLVSHNFLASEFIAHEELPPLLEAARIEGVRILWVLISPCVHEATEISKYQAAHDIDHALTTLDTPDRQRVLADVCRRIYEAALPPEAVKRSEA